METIKQYHLVLRKEKKYFYFIVGLCLLGFFIGIFLHKIIEREVLVENVCNFYIQSMSINGSSLSIIFANFFIDVALISLFFIFSLSVYLYPLKALILFYFSYVLGAALTVFISVLGISGLFLYLFTVFLHAIFTFYALIIFSVSSYNLDKTCKTKKGVSDRKLKLLVFCLLVMLIGVLITAILLICVLRPFNFVV